MTPTHLDTLLTAAAFALVILLMLGIAAQIGS